MPAKTDEPKMKALPGGKNGKAAAPPPDDDEEEGEAEATDRAAIAAIDAAIGATSGEGDPAFQRIEMGATLQDAKVSAARNGDNYDVKYEIGSAGFGKLAAIADRGKGSFSVTWSQMLVGNGGEIRRMSATRDADGAMHYYISVHFPQSEISRSLGRMGTMLRQHGKIVLDPEQGELGLPDGSKVDLTARA
jgi:hypothetical protein